MMKSILIGIVIGIANIIPGVSGGTMAVSMGIYDKMIHCVTHLFKEFKKSVMFLFPIVIGAGLSLVLVSRLIEFLFGKYPLQTNMAFIGLIVGGLPVIWGKVKGNTIRLGHLLSCIIFFAIVVGLAAIGEQEGATADLSFNLLSVVKLFLIGIIASATMVIPGVSGSMVLLLLGYYNAIISAINAFITAVLAFDVGGIIKGMGVLVPLGLGIVIGIFVIAKIIEIIFEKFPLHAYWAIIGLIVASPIGILLLNSMGTITLLSVVTGVLTFVAGFVVAMKLGE